MLLMRTDTGKPKLIEPWKVKCKLSALCVRKEPISRVSQIESQSVNRKMSSSVFLGCTYCVPVSRQ